MSQENNYIDINDDRKITRKFPDVLCDRYIVGVDYGSGRVESFSTGKVKNIWYDKYVKIVKE